MNSIERALSFAVGLAVSFPSVAQDQRILEEVIVTAQKREQNLQTTALSIDVVSGDKVNAAQIGSVAAIAALSPSVHIDAFPATQPRPFIRGIGSSDTGVGGDQSAVFYVDGVYMQRPGMLAFDSFDVERVEVLKGPQGTLWGKNVAGGLMHVINNQPGEETDAKLQATVGNEGILHLSGMLNMKLGDEILSRFVVMSRQNDGFAKNINTGNDLFDEDRVSYRAMFRYDPTESLELGLSFSGSDEDNAGSARNQFDGSIVNLSRDPDGDIRKTTGEIDGFDKRELFSSTFTLNWSTGLGDVHLIASYRDLELDFLEDIDGNNISDLDGEYGNVLQAQRGTAEDSDATSIELRLSAPESSNIFWQTGVYYEELDVAQRTDVSLAFLGGTEVGITTNETTSAAIFGELVYPVSERTNLTAGARWNTDEKENTQDTSLSTRSITIDEPFDLVGESDSWEEITWKLTLDSQFNENVFGYATISTGYKAGGFQDVAPNPKDAVDSFDPENVTNYEVGARAELFDGRARFNVTAFFMDYTDLQVRQVDGVISVTANAGEAEVKGIEVDAMVVPLDGLELGVKYTYLDNEFTEFVEGGVDFSGNTIQRSPEHAYVLSAAYYVPLSGGELSFEADYSWTDDQFHDNSNRPPEIVTDYAVLDARIGFSTGNWDFLFWGKNLADEEYATHYPSFGGISFLTFNPPRTYGVTASWQLK